MLSVFILKVKILQTLPEGHPTHEAIAAILDPERLEIMNRIKNPASKAAAEGAGLLLQLAATGLGGFGVTFVTVNDILKLIKKPVCLEYEKNENGKPFFKNPGLPHFNISHSGDYVVLALADTEVGVDVQIRRNKRELEMAERFFPQPEIELIKSSKTYFYNLWTRKEAWGKCEGVGARPALEKDFSDLSKWTEYKWFEKEFDDYYLTVCQSLH